MTLATQTHRSSGRDTDHRAATLTVLTTQLPNQAATDRACTLILTPLVAQARTWNSQRWYFSRRPAKGGILLETRFSGAADSGRRITSFLAALRQQSEEELGLLPTEVSTRRHTSAGSSPDSGSEDSLQLYRLGGEQGLNLAEELFELSSDLTLWAVSRFATAQTRRALLALLMYDAADAMMRGPRSAAWADRRRVSWDFFWDAHLDTTLGRIGRSGGHSNRSFHRQVSTLLHREHAVMRAAAAEQSVHNWRRKWLRGVDNYLYRADKAGVSRCAQQLTLHQIHEMAARFGMDAQSESQAGIQSRHWKAPQED